MVLVSQKQVFINKSGDSVMVGKGFDISCDLPIHGCRLNMPILVKGGHLSNKIFQKKNVGKSQKMASHRIYVKCAFGRIKQYHILTMALFPSVLLFMLTLFGLLIVLLLYFILLWL